MIRSFQYPWLRTELMAYLRELSDPEYQAKNWLLPRENKIVGISPLIDFFFDSQNIENPEGAVGLYLVDDEVAVVKAAANSFSAVVDDLSDIYDSAGAMNHPGRPKVIETARSALSALEKNEPRPSA